MYKLVLLPNTQLTIQPYIFNLLPICFTIDDIHLIYFSYEYIERQFQALHEGKSVFTIYFHGTTQPTPNSKSKK